jgi:hypothetical protein
MPEIDLRAWAEDGGTIVRDDGSPGGLDRQGALGVMRGGRVVCG